MLISEISRYYIISEFYESYLVMNICRDGLIDDELGEYRIKMCYN
jgi:hypothetical protein